MAKPTRKQLLAALTRCEERERRLMCGPAGNGMLKGHYNLPRLHNRIKIREYFWPEKIAIWQELSYLDKDIEKPRPLANLLVDLPRR